MNLREFTEAVDEKAGKLDREGQQRIGDKALEKIDGEYVIRSEIALKTAEAAKKSRSETSAYGRPTELKENTEVKHYLGELRFFSGDFTYAMGQEDRKDGSNLSGQFRGHYNSVAALAAALGEVRESMGMPSGKERTMQKYKEEFPRHNAFGRELRSYGMNYTRKNGRRYH